MQAVTEKDKNIKLVDSVVTIGTFDGLHVGHKEIIESLKSKAKETNLASVVITFFPHPRSIITEDFDLKLLTPIDEKKVLFRDWDIDYLYIIDFTKEFSKKTYKEFFEEVLIKRIGAKHLVIGYDHKFGKDRAGNINKLKEYTQESSIGLTIIGPKEVNSENVSSTKIRNALLEGDLDKANEFLGRSYKIEGIVVEGAKRGRTLGFPTANLGLKENNKLIPHNGVYFVKVKLGVSSYFGVANIGLRPTFNNAHEPITEVYILDFNEDIYGEKITVEFLKRIRDEKKFSSKFELEDNIKKDVEISKKYIKEFKNN